MLGCLYEKPKLMQILLVSSERDYADIAYNVNKNNRFNGAIDEVIPSFVDNYS